MNIGWLDTIHYRCGEINEVACQLKSLARAFSRIGNDNTADELFAIADTLSKAQREVVRAIGQMLNDQVKEGDKQLGELVSAVIGLPKEDAQ